MRPLPATGLAALDLSESALHASAAALQGLVAARISAAVPSPALSAPTVKVATLSLLHLRFVCRVSVYRDLPPIWEAVVRGNGQMEGLSTLNQSLIRGLPSCCQIFRGRGHLSASPLLLAFVKNVSLLNPSLDSPRIG